MKKTTLFMFCLFLMGYSWGQTVTLPYYTGFDNATQTAGWTEYKKGGTATGGWEYVTYASHIYSAPQALGQIYSTSENVDNWFVSPGFSIPSGGSLDSIRYQCSGLSTPGDGDTVAFYLLNGSQDPSTATSKTLLIDMRGDEFVNDNVYKKKSAISLPSGTGLSYFAIRFRCTAEVWLETYFDNIRISDAVSSGINESSANEHLFSIYPNPASEVLKINAISDKEQIQLFNSQGMLLKEFEVTKALDIDIRDLSAGMYIVHPKNHPEVSQKFIKR